MKIHTTHTHTHTHIHCYIFPLQKIIHLLRRVISSSDTLVRPQLKQRLDSPHSNSNLCETLQRRGEHDANKKAQRGDERYDGKHFDVVQAVAEQLVGEEAGKGRDGDADKEEGKVEGADVVEAANELELLGALRSNELTKRLKYAKMCF